jgi:AraC-like DNA-binding protein
VSSGRRWRERAAATGHLYAPGTHYWERLEERHLPVESVWIIFRGDGLGLEEMIHGANSLAIFRDPEGALGDALMAVNRLEDEYPGRAFLRGQEALFRILRLLRESTATEEGVYRVATDPKADRTASLQSRVNHYLQAHYADRIALRDLASAMAMSESSLSHRYRRETGTTPMETLTEIRLTQVKKLLMLGLPLREIAAQTGYYDEFHLSKTFKKRLGLNPSDFREG